MLRIVITPGRALVLIGCRRGGNIHRSVEGTFPREVKVYSYGIVMTASDDPWHKFNFRMVSEDDRLNSNQQMRHELLQATQRGEEAKEGTDSACRGPLTIDAAETEEHPHTVAAQLEVEAIREKVEEMRHVAKGLCRRDAKGTDESNYPIDESIVTPWGRAASDLAEYSKGSILCNVGTTAVLRVDAAGGHGESLLDTEVSKSFIRQERAERLQLKARRPSKECMLTLVNSEEMYIGRPVKRFTTWGGRERSTEDFLCALSEVVLGLDSLTTQRVVWYLQSDKLRTHVNETCGELTVARSREKGTILKEYARGP
ncbi:hypothetical protein, conserved [Eimeria praecox]|uniref:Uncharacterized protein n=1 Tax=Eimeria praecox TaxID=51316 RepID=U6H521_9EIME|nr:hypothetical protein, conserved [Eimeria praecox]